MSGTLAVKCLSRPIFVAPMGRDKPSLSWWTGLCLHGHWWFYAIATLSPLVLCGKIFISNNFSSDKFCTKSDINPLSWLFPKSNLDFCKIPKLILQRRECRTFSDFSKSRFLWFFDIPSYYGFWKYQKWFKVRDKLEYHFWFFKTTLVFRVYHIKIFTSVGHHFWCWCQHYALLLALLKWGRHSVGN